MNPMNFEDQLKILFDHIKSLAFIDTSFPSPKFKALMQRFPERVFWMPGKESVAPAFAVGLATLGQKVLVYGVSTLPLTDETLAIKRLVHDPKANLSHLEEQILAFGPADILIPMDASANLQT